MLLKVCEVIFLQRDYLWFLLLLFLNIITQKRLLKIFFAVKSAHDLRFCRVLWLEIILSVRWRYAFALVERCDYSGSRLGNSALNKRLNFGKAFFCRWDLIVKRAISSYFKYRVTLAKRKRSLRRSHANGIKRVWNYSRWSLNNFSLNL